MIPRDHLANVLHLAAQAPSGDNAQPWRFEARDDWVDVFNIPGKDYSPYNFRELGSIFANGAAIENAVVAASSLGYVVNVQPFPKPADPTYVARLTFLPEKVFKDPLADYILLRATNRKPYEKRRLSPEDRTELQNSVRDSRFGELHLLEDQKYIDDFAKAVSLSDQLIFEEKSIHDAIYGSIRWTLEEEEKKKGMYIKTLELPPPAQLLFKAFKSWPRLVFMNRFGISKFIASQSAKVFASSAAIGLLIIPGDKPEDYMNAGRTFERVWLTATKLGLWIQPVGALAYLAVRVANHDAGELTESHTVAITEVQNHILDLFGNPKGTVAMMFRVGYAGKPTAHSRKDNPNVTYL